MVDWDRLLGSLGEKEQLVLRLRFGADREMVPRTFEEVGIILQMTPSKVRTVEAEAIRKLRSGAQ